MQRAIALAECTCTPSFGSPTHMWTCTQRRSQCVSESGVSESGVFRVRRFRVSFEVSVYVLNRPQPHSEGGRLSQRGEAVDTVEGVGQEVKT